MTILLSDPRVLAIEVRELGEPLIALPEALQARGAPRVRVRAGVADRLCTANAALPPGMRLCVVEGYRAAADQCRIYNSYCQTLSALHPGADRSEIETLASRYVAPLAVAPHVAGAAVARTLVDSAGNRFDLGTPRDATPEDSHGGCYLAARNVPPMARYLRALLAEALGAAGMVNYPTEWWHWSYGDRYWALMTGAPQALYGPLQAEVAA